MENSDLHLKPHDNDSTLDINYDSPEWKASALLYTQNYFKKSYQLASAVQEDIDKTGQERSWRVAAPERDLGVACNTNAGNFN